MIPTLSTKNDMNMNEILSEVERQLDSVGLDELIPGFLHGGLTRPRPVEIAGAIIRLKTNESITQNSNTTGVNFFFSAMIQRIFWRFR